jgi:hypothetical protein
MLLEYAYAVHVRVDANVLVAKHSLFWDAVAGAIVQSVPHFSSADAREPSEAPQSRCNVTGPVWRTTPKSAYSCRQRREAAAVDFRPVPAQARAGTHEKAAGAVHQNEMDRTSGACCWGG